MGKCKHSAQVLQTDYSFWIDGVHLDYWFCCNCGERLYVGRDRRENPKAGREEFRKELEDLKRYERERNFYDYSDIIEKAKRELAGRECPILEQLKIEARKGEEFAHTLWDQGDQANAHFQEGRAKGIMTAVKAIEDGDL
jgi:hypothetical protein